mgnify:CR=1 FL=1
MTESKWDHQLYKEPMVWLYGQTQSFYGEYSCSVFLDLKTKSCSTGDQKVVYTPTFNQTPWGQSQENGCKKCKEIFPQCGKGRSSTQLFYYRSCTSWCNCTLDENKGEEQHHFGTLWIAKLYGYGTSFEVILVSHEKSKLWFLYKRPPTICMYIVNIHRSHGW